MIRDKDVPGPPTPGVEFDGLFIVGGGPGRIVSLEEGAPGDVEGGEVGVLAHLEKVPRLLQTALAPEDEGEIVLGLPIGRPGRHGPGEDGDLLLAEREDEVRRHGGGLFEPGGAFGRGAVAEEMSEPVEDRRMDGSRFERGRRVVDEAEADVERGHLEPGLVRQFVADEAPADVEVFRVPMEEVALEPGQVVEGVEVEETRQDTVRLGLPAGQPMGGRQDLEGVDAPGVGLESFEGIFCGPPILFFEDGDLGRLDLGHGFELGRAGRPAQGFLGVDEPAQPAGGYGVDIVRLGVIHRNR
jgi:hypothetical protein